MPFQSALETFPLILTFGGWLLAPKIHRTKELTLTVLLILFALMTWLFFTFTGASPGTSSLLSFSFNRPSLFVGAIFCGALFAGLFPVRKEVTFGRDFLLLLGAGMGIVMADNMPTFFLFFFLQRIIPGWKFFRNMRDGHSHSGGTYLIQHLLCLICVLVLLMKSVFAGYILYPLMDYPAEFFSLDVLLLCFIIVYQSHGIFPFHSWVHDLVDEIRWFELAAIFLPQAGVLLYAQLMLPNYSSGPELFKIMLLALSIFSSIYWSYRGIYEENVQKQVTYFYISQASLILTGLQATSVALRGSYLHMMVISFSGIALWSILSHIQGHVSFRKSQSYYGLAQDFPKLAALFCLFGFCLIGVPLLAAFVAEDLVINGLLEHHPYLGLGHIFATCLNGILFFLMFSKLFLGSNPSRKKTVIMDMSLVEMFPYLVILIMMFFIGIFPFMFLEKISW